ncbi:MAG TPA: cupin domain-containing protein [Jatrophihabitans sp.]|jgi:mannose-6-phosphate isomerase-like protein (cupin superfamily)|nr:cupin domain-containing protein [Jatrophihabitans sp.]
MSNEVVNLAERFTHFTELWSPKVVARVNDYEVKVVRLEGEFPWHEHADTDELFLVLEGVLMIRLRDREVVLRPGELFVVAKGVEHSPLAEHEVRAVLIEPTGVVNTGSAGGSMTASYDDTLA